MASANNCIRINQLGYRICQFKEVIVSGSSLVLPKTFHLVDKAGTVVFGGVLSSVIFDKDSGDFVSRGDFSAYETAGIYRIRIDGLGDSYQFKISDDVYADVARLTARWFCLQRSGAAKNDSETGIRHGADLLAPAILWDADGVHPDSRFDVSGGWWDAGDYGRYVSPGATSAMMLMVAHQLNPAAFSDGSLGIPESGNCSPDILDEIRWELNWLLKMQRADGAVHHKVSHAAYPSGMPDTIFDDLYLHDISTQATCQFCGTIAKASLVFSDHDKEFSSRLLNSARRAWCWLESHPEKYPAKGFENPLDETGMPTMGGPYAHNLPNEIGHRLWAAASLFEACGESRFAKAAVDLWKARDSISDFSGLAWTDGYAFGMFAFVNATSADPQVVSEMKTVIHEQSERILSVIQSTGYHVALKHDTTDFPYQWGSNANALERGVYLMLANRISPDSRYVVAASQQIDWILGVNPLGVCFVNGPLGSNPIKTSHHDLSRTLGFVVPGSIGEGPNGLNSGGDLVLEALIAKGTPPAKCYADSEESYASNEPTIYANAAFVAVLSSFL